MAEIKWSAEQKKVLDSNRPMLVSAGAGSGKTAIMTEKAYSVLKGGADIKRIAILTFGNAAAAEMKFRLLERIKRGVYEEEEPIAERLRGQLQNFSLAHITTISAFCIGLTKKYFNVAGVSPSFVIADEKETEKMKEKAVSRVLTEYLEKDDERFLSLSALVSSQRKLDNLEALVRTAFEFMSLAPDREAVKEKIIGKEDFFSTPAFAYLKNYFNSTVNDFTLRGKETVKLLYERGLPEYAEYIKECYVDYLESLENLETPEDFKNFLLKPYPDKKLPTVKGADESVKAKMNGYRDEIKKFFKEELNFYRDWDDNLKREALSRENLDFLLELYGKFETEYKKIKEDVSKLDFNDVERCALKIIRAEGELAAREYDYIFVDEYQDTNFIQEEILTGLQKNAVPFMVGDVKQAIYKFRSAEPKIFLAKMQSYLSGGAGECVRLKDNYRSDWRILDFVNEVFSVIMTESFGGIDYKNTAAFNKKEEYPAVSNFPAVEIAELSDFEKEDCGENCGIYSVKESVVAGGGKISLDALYIADKIKNLVETGLIWDDKIKSARKIRYKDIAIFFIARARNMDIVNDLSALGIPLYTGAFKEEDTTEEIEAVLSILKVVDNFKNDIPLASAMLSYFGGFTEDELLKIRQNGNLNTQFWDNVLRYNGNDEVKSKIDVFLSLIKGLRYKSEFCDVFGLVSELIQTTGFDAYVMHRPSGAEKIAALNSFLQSLYGDKSAIELCEFLNHAESYKNACRVTPSLDGVSVFTVHKSKGLEFPIVFLAGAYQRKNDKIAESDLLLDNELGAGVRFFDKEKKIRSATLSYRAILLKKRNEEAEEFLRTFYVALTRAKNHLFICGERPERGGAYSYMRFLLQAREGNIALARYFKEENGLTPPITKDAPEKPPLVCSPDGGIIGALEKGLKKDYAQKGATALGVKYSASHLKESVGEADAMRRINLVSAEEGINYHKILEYLDYDFSTEQDIEAAVKKLAEQGVLEDAPVDTKILYDCLNSDIIRKAAALPHYKEKQFMLYLPASELAGIIENIPSVSDKILLQGVIDLLILDGETAIIVDFKFSKKDTCELKDIYKAQLSAYEIAVKKLLGAKDVKKVLYLAYQRETVEL